MIINKMPLAFTLAEVLITIGIIGIIAEITIPTMIANTQRIEFATLFKKNYSNMQNMFKMYMAEQGVDNIGATNLYAASDTSTSVQDELDNLVRRSFKVIKSCRLDTGDASCAITEKYLGTTQTYTVASGTTYYAFISVDGIETFIRLLACTPDFSKPGKIKAVCGNIMYDVNGTKKPNTYGKDFFASFLINYDGTLYPTYGQEWSKFMSRTDWRNDTTTCGSTGNPDLTDVTGMGCAARIIENSWVIDYW